MKKLLLFVVAMTSLVSCSVNSNKPVNINNDIEEEVIEFRELKDEDFREIEVKLNKQDGEAPVSIESYDISEAFEPVMSPCKKTAKFERHCYANYPENATDEEKKLVDEYNEELEAEERKEFEEIKNNPFKGNLNNSVLDGDELYFVVDYDNYCHDHCLKLWKYNISTSELTLVFEFSDPEESFDIRDLAVINNEIFITSDSHKKDETTSFNYETIYRFDSSSGEFKNCLPEEYYCNPGMLIFDSHNGNRLIAHSVYGDINSGNSNKIYYEYNFDTAEWEIFDIQEPQTDETDNGNTRLFIRDNELISCYTGKKDMKVRYGERFSLEVPLRSSYLVGYSRNSISFLTKDTANVILRTYNIDKMEKYEINLTSFGFNVVVHNLGNELFYEKISGSGNMFIIPEAGAGIKIGENLTGFYDNNDAVWSFTNAYDDSPIIIYGYDGIIMQDDKDTASMSFSNDGKVYVNIIK